MKLWKNLLNFSTVIFLLLIAGCSTPAMKSENNNVKADLAIITPSSAGEVTLSTASSSITIGSSFVTELHLNSGSQKFAAYTFSITFNSSIVNLNTSIGTNGVEAGTDGFISAVNATLYRVIISGFDTSGKGPGSNLTILKINWNALAAGSANFQLTISTLADNNTANIGTPKATIQAITVQNNAIMTPTGTPTGIYRTPTPTPTPSSTHPIDAGTVTLSTTSTNVQIGQSFVTNLYLNSGNQKFSAYNFIITYNSNVVTLDTSIGSNNGVETGPDGFISAVNATNGKITIAGFDTAGKGPGANLSILKINWKAVGGGNAGIQMTISSLVDNNTNIIGTPKATIQTIMILPSSTSTPVITINPTPTVSGIYTPTPTKIPTATPTGIIPVSVGEVTLNTLSTNIQPSQSFLTNLYLNSGTQKFAAYNFVITYNSNAVMVNTSIGYNGVEAGPDGFITAVNAETGKITIAGFDTVGKGPGANLNILKINWKAVGGGNSGIQMTISILVDNDTKIIGTPKASVQNIIIFGPGTVPPPTLTPVVTRTPTATPTIAPTQPPIGNISCTIDPSIWSNGGLYNIIIKNNGSTTINGWTLVWNFNGSEVVNNLWNGTYTQSGNTVTVKNMSYNSTISSNGGTVTLGCTFAMSGSTSTKPSSVTVNGVTVPVP